MTFLPQDFNLAIQSFGGASVAIVVGLTTIVIIELVETIRQEIKLKREQKRRAAKFTD